MSGNNVLYSFQNSSLNVQPGFTVPTYVNLDMRAYDAYVLIYESDANLEADVIWKPNLVSTPIKEKTIQFVASSPQIVTGTTKSLALRVILRNNDVVPLTSLSFFIAGIKNA